MRAMITNTNRGSPKHDGFPRRVRKITTDRYGPNEGGEKAYNAMRPGFSLNQTFCHLHIMVGGLQGQRKLIKPFANGVKSYIFALRAPGQMPKIRTSFGFIACRKLEVAEGQQPPEDEDARAYKMLVLDTYVPATSNEHCCKDYVAVVGPERLAIEYGGNR